MSIVFQDYVCISVYCKHIDCRMEYTLKHIMHNDCDTLMTMPQVSVCSMRRMN